ncbi:unnamed protein product [Debaryomyces tyrocola]|nr:unnamed protein product [Debaryomyces tyrocola]
MWLFDWCMYYCDR